jgi:hypothetical protein
MANDPSLLRVGGIGAFGVALAYVASGLCAALMPSELQGRPEVTAHEFWLALSRDPLAHLAYHWAWVAAGLFGLAAVPAISAFVWPANRGAVLWAGSGAWLGFAVNARSHLMEIAFDRKIIPAYADADPAFQQAVHVVAGLALDVPNGFLTYGVIGVWVAVVSVLGLRSGRLPRALCLLGFANAGTYGAGLLGYLFLSHALLVVSIGVGGLLIAPLWYAWLGVILLRKADRGF